MKVILKNKKKMEKEYLSYYENGIKEYEGNFKFDKYEGRGILYDKKGNKKYEGIIKMVMQMEKE